MRGANRFNHLPTATYRLQLNRNFTFRQATELLPYLAELGISDVYASPPFLAGPESTHGYDICAFDRLNPNLGTPGDFRAFTDSIRKHRLGLLLDMVPNHMSTSAANLWWQDVLQNGAESEYASFFDINWNLHPDRKVVVPVLGDRYGEVLKRGELRLDFNETVLSLAYFDKKFPLSHATQEQLRKEANYNPRDPGGIHTLKRVLQAINSNPEKLHEIIRAQHYRLAFWRVGLHEINYRRFFDLAELISLRVEDPQVFESAHRFILELLKAGQVTGLRIDHPDGLLDPKTYFDCLQNSAAADRLFVVAEKILSCDERLPEDWAVSGTTGYDYLNYLNGLFIAQENEQKFTQIYSAFTGSAADYTEVEHEAKKYVLRHLFPKEVYVLTHRLRKIAEQTAEGLDFSTLELEQAIVEYTAAFPVYRTYARAGLERLPPPEEQFVRTAVRRASERAPALASALKFLEKLLLLQPLDPVNNALKSECAEFVFRFQQLTGPATAKGLEDTAFYRYVRFVSLNEVGGDPGRFGTDLETFHQYNLHKQQRWPHSLLASSTHDTKRGEDVRARLNVLSEIPEEWQTHVQQWSEWTRAFKSNSGEPDAADEYLLYQTLVGSWTGASDLDAYIGRIQQYMHKATREAKRQTSWTDPNPAYEQATQVFVDAILRSDRFRASFEPFARRVGFFGVFNSLSQVLLKICSPGIPDFYQGTELWDFNLVDPDNRWPVDYELRKQALARVKNADYRDLLRNAGSGDVKMFVTRTALHLRNRHRELFENGEYLALHPAGTKARHVISFARRLDSKTIVVIAPRFPLLLADGETKPPVGSELWGDTELQLPAQTYRNQFTGQETSGSVKLADILTDFPLALLESVG